MPARLGSKGVPFKNLRNLAGKSLVSRAIDSARIGDQAGEIYVSSESPLVLDHVKDAGVKFHFRTQEASEDEATADLVVADFIFRLSLEPSDVIVYLQPTSPLRTSHHVKSALQTFFTSGRHPLVSVQEVSEHPMKMLKILGKSLAPYIPGGTPTANRQGLERLYIPNGAIYIFQVKEFTRLKAFPVFGATPFIMQDHESIDINREFDLQLAEILLNQEDWR